MTFICCFLWGSAFPCIKTGYRLFAIASDDTAGQILFAGIRFTLAGVLVVAVGSLVHRRFLYPKRGSGIPILILALFQTAGQYVFFYVGMAHTTGVKSAILVAAGNFFTILIEAERFGNVIKQADQHYVGTASVFTVTSGKGGHMPLRRRMPL